MLFPLNCAIKKKQKAKHLQLLCHLANAVTSRLLGGRWVACVATCTEMHARRWVIIYRRCIPLFSSGRPMLKGNISHRWETLHHWPPECVPLCVARCLGWSGVEFPAGLPVSVTASVHCSQFRRFLVAQLCPTLCSPIDCSRPGSCVHGILQARVLELVAISSYREPSPPRDRACASCISCTGRQILYH